MKKNLQWFPGHMAKGIKKLNEYKKIVDLMVEIVDARAPKSTKIGEFEKIFESKFKILILNKIDLADEKKCDEIIKSYKNYDEILKLNIKNSKDVNILKKVLRKYKDKKNQKNKNFNLPLRVIIVGIPNVGKSTLINQLCSKNKLKMENRPGVTKELQLIKIENQIELIDTPGIGAFKFDNDICAKNVALIGSITDKILYHYELAYYLINSIKNYKSFIDYYELEESLKDDNMIFEHIANKKGCFKKGGVIDEEKTSKLILNDYKNLKLGRITLDS
jgi:ribosome biogenesis GTPase A